MKHKPQTASAQEQDKNKNKNKNNLQEAKPKPRSGDHQYHYYRGYCDVSARSTQKQHGIVTALIVISAGDTVDVDGYGC
jgi:hypothetical protein